MKEEWLFPNAIVPVDVETTAALVAEIKRLIDVVGGMALAQPEFIKHEVENADWSEWVCPDPKNYLMKCCDCGLVHEAEFGVVRYKSETEREDCDMVDDPNLQAVFRMRRSEEWTQEDTAHRVGGLPLAQPAQEVVDCHATGVCVQSGLRAEQPTQQEPVGYFYLDDDIGHVELVPHQQLLLNDGDKLYTTPPPQENTE